MSKTKKPALMGPVRQNLEAFGVAILAAVLLKWFCIEAYQIPTSSMQPTLMGSSEAGVYDRILVDKLLPAFREPKRWDITVFKYPLQRNQSYVKRIGGMPNDRLHIAGGNLYQVADADGRRTFTVLKKPADLQEAMWKNVYPARRLTRSETKALGAILAASPSSAVSEDEQGFVLDPRGALARLTFRDEVDGGLIDRVFDGYPPEVARPIREQSLKKGLFQAPEIVVDARLAATVLAEQAVDELSLEIEVLRPGLDDVVFGLVVKQDKATLQVRGKNRVVLGESPAFDLRISPGTPTRVAFAHVDDDLVAWQDGSELQRFDGSAWACRDGCVLPFDGRVETPPNQKSLPQFVVRSKGKVRLDDLCIDRDQHYTRSGAPDVIEVPDGHYYMLGDNTLQSIDSRGWTAVTIGVDAEGHVVPPDSDKAVRQVIGNKRPMPLRNHPDRDETPIAYPDEKAIVMIDRFGEIVRYGAEIGPDWGERGGVAFQVPGAQDGRGEWMAPETTNTKEVNFVPRSDIQGRALLVFYPARPLSWLFGNAWPGRFGTVR
jgi:signal peptidase I